MNHYIKVDTCYEPTTVCQCLTCHELILDPTNYCTECGIHLTQYYNWRQDYTKKIHIFCVAYNRPYPTTPYHRYEVSLETSIGSVPKFSAPTTHHGRHQVLREARSLKQRFQDPVAIQLVRGNTTHGVYYL